MTDMMQQPVTEQSIPIAPINGGNNHLLKFNERLDENRHRPLNEKDFDNMLADFSDQPQEATVLCFLTLARIAELAVVTTGRYVDGGHFTAAGDFLVNPKQVDVYVNGETIPIRKERHSKLSDQLAHRMDGAAPVPWLTHNIMIRIRRKAFLPHLRDLLAQFGALSKPYLAHFDRRLSKAVDTISFLMSWRISGSEELAQRLKTVSASEKRFIEENLCRFGWDGFHELGEELFRAARASNWNRDSSAVNDFDSAFF